MNFFQYLRYLPFLIQLITFIRQAEAVYRGPGKGVEKLASVVGQFTSTVTAGEQSGLIPAKLANSLRDGATVIVTVIVQVMNATVGSVPPLTETLPLNGGGAL